MNPITPDNSSKVTYTSVSDNQPIAVDTNPGPIEHPHSRIQTGSKRCFVESPAEERLTNGARPGDTGMRADYHYHDGLNTVTYPGLPLKDRDGRSKVLRENTYTVR